MPSRIAVFLQQELVERGWQQADLVKRSGINKSTIGRIVNDEVDEVKATQIGQLANALGMPFWNLMQVAGYTLETPGDPDEETQRMASALTLRPRLRTIMRESEELTPEEQDATIAYIRTVRQARRNHFRDRDQE